MKHFSILVLLMLSAVATADPGIIQGYIKDATTGTPFVDVLVEIYLTDDSSKPMNTTRTNAQGYYGVEVLPDLYYDIIVRVGDMSPSQRTSSPVKGNSVYKINFEINTETSQSQVLVERYGFWVVALVAVLIMSVIVIDQIFMRKKRVMKALEKEKMLLEKKLDDEEESGEDDLTRLQKERDQMEYMVNLTKIKYHKRKIDEESFREIVRDYSKKMIELEAKINRLKDS